MAREEAMHLAAEIKDLMKIELEEKYSICLEEDATQDLVETQCHDLFHPACITGWRNSGQPAAHSCPSCRTALPGLQ